MYKIQECYLKTIGKELIPYKFGFPNLLQLLNSMEEVVNLRRTSADSDWMVSHVSKEGWLL